MQTKTPYEEEILKEVRDRRVRFRKNWREFFI